jgi:hypothetical protein
MKRRTVLMYTTIFLWCALVYAMLTMQPRSTTAIGAAIGLLTILIVCLTVDRAVFRHESTVICPICGIGVRLDESRREQYEVCPSCKSR